MDNNGFKIKGIRFNDDHALIIERNGKRVKVARSEYGLWDLFTETEAGFNSTFGTMGLRDAVQNAKELLEGDEL